LVCVQCGRTLTIVPIEVPLRFYPVERPGIPT